MDEVFLTKVKFFFGINDNFGLVCAYDILVCSDRDTIDYLVILGKSKGFLKSGMSNLFASLGHTGRRRIVSGPT